MTEIYFVRHPESEKNADPSIVGGRSNCTPVTHHGIQQSRLFSKAFSKQYPTPDVLYSSPAVRTTTLLDIYSEETDWKRGYFIEPNLQEMSQGDAENQPRVDIYTPEVIARIRKEVFDFSLPNGESLNEVADRMLEWAYQMEKKHPDSTILAATHGQAIRASVGRLLGWNHFETTLDPLHITPNVSVTHLTIKGGVATVNFWGKEIIEEPQKQESELY